ncbi:MAG: hypothetical protein JO340_09230 [Acidobacteriaceae bacterium]|nr:hypothetical protein [Acidobacteriaceae bacterium]
MTQTVRPWNLQAEKGQEHETGHPMGLMDQSGIACSTQTSQLSMMNFACDVNDTNNNMPTSPQRGF